MKKELLASFMVVLMLVTVLSAGYSANAISINVKKEDIIVEYIKSNDEDYIYYYDEASAGCNGIGPACDCCGWKSAIRLTQDELEQYNNWNLTGVNVLRWGGGEHSGIIEVFGEGTPNEPGPIITSAPYYFNESDWFRVNLNESVPIKEHNEIWIVVNWSTKHPYNYPAAVDDRPPVYGKSDWVYLPNSEWLELYHYGFYCSWCMEAIVQQDEINQPPESPTIIGPTHGIVDVFYTYTFNSIDPDFDDVSYYIDWDDGTTSGWTVFQPSGNLYSEDHNWSKTGDYNIKAKTKDSFGVESEWSDPFNVIIIIDVEPPTVKIIKPVKGLYINNTMIRPFLIRIPLIIGDIIIMVDATDDETGIQKVEFYTGFFGTNLLGNDTTAPYFRIWRRDRLRFIHKHILKVVAYDNAGNIASDKIIVRKFF